MFFKLIILINVLVLIKCEPDSIKPLNETSPQTNGTEGGRKPKDILDMINNAIGSGVAGAVNAVSDTVIRGVIGSKRLLDI